MGLNDYITHMGVYTYNWLASIVSTVTLWYQLAKSSYTHTHHTDIHMYIYAYTHIRTQTWAHSDTHTHLYIIQIYRNLKTNTRERRSSKWINLTLRKNGKASKHFEQTFFDRKAWEGREHEFLAFPLWLQLFHPKFKHDDPALVSVQDLRQWTIISGK